MTASTKLSGQLNYYSYIEYKKCKTLDQTALDLLKCMYIDYQKYNVVLRLNKNDTSCLKIFFLFGLV